MGQIGLAVHRFRTEALAIASCVVAWASKHGYSVVAEETDLGLLQPAGVAAGRLSSSDVVVSIGGDGTVLRTVRALQGAVVPIIGVNLGQLGCLADLEPAEIEQALTTWHSGSAGMGYRHDDRMLLSASLHADNGESTTVGERGFFALNEVVVEKQEAGHTIRVLVEIDGSSFTTYVGGGVSVATPAG